VRLKKNEKLKKLKMLDNRNPLHYINKTLNRTVGLINPKICIF